MDKYLSEKYILKINQIKSENWEELYLIIKYSLEILVNKYLNKKNNKKEIINLIKEFYSVFKEERKILNFIIFNIVYIKEEKLINCLDELDKLNEQTINYFYTMLDNIEDDIILDKEENKNFNLLPYNRNIKNNVCDLIFSKELVKSYLGFEDDFWRFIDNHTIFTDDLKQEKLEWSYVDEKQIKLKMILPNIIDLKTTLIAIRGYTKAHVLYFNNYKTNLDNPLEKVKKYDISNRKYFNI